jgi:hypothetical protein
MQQTENNAVVALKKAKSKGLTYYEATRTLIDQGYTESQIEQASYQFEYTDIDTPDEKSKVPLSPAASIAFGEAVMKEKTLDSLREERDSAYLKSAFFGRYVPLYNINATRAWANYSAAKYGQSKSKVYSSWVFAMAACVLIFPLSGLIVIKLHLSPYFLAIFFFVGIYSIGYLLNRYLRIKN